MAWSRVAEAHAESSDLEIMFFPISSSYTIPTRSNTEALTGSYSWRFGNKSGALILPLSGVSVMRTSIGHMMDSLLLAGDVDVFAVWQENTADAAVEVRLMEDENEVRLYVDGSLKDSAVMVDSLIADYWVHLKLVVDAITGYVSVYREMPGPTEPSYAARILTYTGAITRTPFSHISYGHRLEIDGYQNYCYMDDIYLDSSSGAENDEMPPSYRFLPSYVDAAGAHNDFTPLSGSNYQMVDDGAVDDGDATCNKALTNSGNPKDSFEHSGVSLPANFNIVAAHAWSVVRKQDAAQQAKIINTFWDGANLAESGPQDVGVSYGYRRGRFTLQPDGTIWTEGDYNAMHTGYKAGGTFS